MPEYIVARAFTRSSFATRVPYLSRNSPASRSVGHLQAICTPSAEFTGAVWAGYFHLNMALCVRECHFICVWGPGSWFETVVSHCALPNEKVRAQNDPLFDVTHDHRLNEGQTTTTDMTTDDRDAKAVTPTYHP